MAPFQRINLRSHNLLHIMHLRLQPFIVLCLRCRLALMTSMLCDHCHPNNLRLLYTFKWVLHRITPCFNAKSSLCMWATGKQRGRPRSFHDRLVSNETLLRHPSETIRQGSRLARAQRDGVPLGKFFWLHCTSHSHTYWAFGKRVIFRSRQAT